MEMETPEMGTKAADSTRFHVKGGKTGSPGGVGAGKIASTTESTYNAVIGYGGHLAPIGAGECICEGNDSRNETKELGATDKMVSAHG